MHATGDCRAVLRYLRTLARTPEGARNAVVFYCLLPEINAKLDKLRPESGSWPFYFPEDADQQLRAGQETVDAYDLKMLQANPDGGDGEKFARYQTALENTWTGDNLREGGNLFLADMAARGLLEVIEKQFSDFRYYEAAACDSWWLMQRWAYLAHPRTFKALIGNLNAYFFNRDASIGDPLSEGVGYAAEGATDLHRLYAQYPDSPISSKSSQ